MTEPKQTSSLERSWTNRKLPVALALVGVLLVGLLVRLEDLTDWQGFPERAFFQGEPLLTTSDGYFYLSLARDLAAGQYERLDTRRVVPDHPERPLPPPLLSVVTAAIHQATSWSLNWIGVLLPVALGVLLAVPLYLFGRFYGGPLMGLLAALIGLLSHYYVYRSSLGFYDTDCLNVTWAMGAAYCFLRFGTRAGRRRYGYLAGGFLIYGLFLWWWDQAPQVVTVVTFLPLLIALAFFYRPARKEGLIFAGLGLLLAGGFLAWQGFEPVVEVGREVIGKFQYISKEETGAFPNPGISIQEQGKPSLNDLVVRTTNSTFALALSLLGLGWLLVRRPKESLFIAVPFLLSLLAVFFARRLMIFLAPTLALGLSFLLVQLWGLRRRHHVLTFLTPVLVGGALFPSLYWNLTKDSWPLEVPVLVEGLTETRKATPEEAVIWTWWDHGYRVRYWAERGTIADGSVHGPELVVHNALPLAASDPRFAANFMHFFVQRGKSGVHQLYQAAGDRERGFGLLKQVLAVGPREGLLQLQKANLKPVGQWQRAEDWLRFFYPALRRPLYLFLDTHQVYASYWWYWFGTWSIAQKTGVHPLSVPFNGNFDRRSYTYNGRSLFDQNPLQMNLASGTGMMGGSPVSIHQGTINKDQEVRSRTFRPHGHYFTVFLPSSYAVLADYQFSRSLFYQLFSQQQAPEEYFRPVLSKAPAYQLFEVHGDTLGESIPESN